MGMELALAVFIGSVGSACVPALFCIFAVALLADLEQLSVCHC
jgi:hypothetical protein